MTIYVVWEEDDDRLMKAFETPEAAQEFVRVSSFHHPHLSVYEYERVSYHASPLDIVSAARMQ